MGVETANHQITGTRQPVAEAGAAPPLSPSGKVGWNRAAVAPMPPLADGAAATDRGDSSSNSTGGENAVRPSQLTRRSTVALATVVEKARRCEALRQRIQTALDEPRSSRPAYALFVFLIVCILISITVLCIETIDDLKDAPPLEYLELACTLVFTVEVLVRVFVASSVKKLLLDAMTWIDIISVVPFYLQIGIKQYGGIDMDDEKNAALQVMQLLRLLRLLRLLKLVRHYEGSIVLWMAFRKSINALVVPMFFLVVCILFFAGLIYYVEWVIFDNYEFDNIFKASWFVLVTLTTVGYGDITPTSWLGQSIAAVAVLSGVLFMAMPITIVGNSFAVVWEEREALKVVLRVQRLLLMRNLHAREVILVFKEFDSSGDAQLDYEEFKNALLVLDVQLPPAKVRQLFRMFDQDGSGQVEYEEFCNMMFPDMEESAMQLALGGPGGPDYVPEESDSPREEQGGTMQRASWDGLCGKLPHKPQSAEQHDSRVVAAGRSRPQPPQPLEGGDGPQPGCSPVDSPTGERSVSPLTVDSPQCSAENALAAAAARAAQRLGAKRTSPRLGGSAGQGWSSARNMLGTPEEQNGLAELVGNAKRFAQVINGTPVLERLDALEAAMDEQRRTLARIEQALTRSSAPVGPPGAATPSGSVHRVAPLSTLLPPTPNDKPTALEPFTSPPLQPPQNRGNSS